MWKEGERPARAGLFPSLEPSDPLTGTPLRSVEREPFTIEVLPFLKASNRHHWRVSNVSASICVSRSASELFFPAPEPAFGPLLRPRSITMHLTEGCCDLLKTATSLRMTTRFLRTKLQRNCTCIQPCGLAPHVHACLSSFPFRSTNQYMLPYRGGGVGPPPGEKTRPDTAEPPGRRTR